MSPGFLALDSFDATGRPSVTEVAAAGVKTMSSVDSAGVVELAGIEPATSALQRRRSPS